uniref:Ig-like domain-containing protein n=1 Tax=Astyanax mexicanus TaxID=7994 RepID=A0A3B1IIW5_ASTMX
AVSSCAELIAATKSCPGILSSQYNSPSRSLKLSQEDSVTSFHSGRLPSHFHCNTLWGTGSSPALPGTPRSCRALSVPSLILAPTEQIFRGETVTLTYDDKDDPVYYSEGKNEYSLSVVESDSGEYTCRGERRSDSQRSEISDAVTLTVSGEFLAQAVLSVSPQNWLTEGDSVTLSCEVRDSSTGWNFSWYKALLSDSSRGSGGSYTLRRCSTVATPPPIPQSVCPPYSSSVSHCHHLPTPSPPIFPLRLPTPSPPIFPLPPPSCYATCVRGSFLGLLNYMYTMCMSTKSFKTIFPLQLLSDS